MGVGEQVPIHPGVRALYGWSLQYGQYLHLQPGSSTQVLGQLRLHVNS